MFSCNMWTSSTASFIVLKCGLELTQKLVMHMCTKILKRRVRRGGVTVESGAVRLLCMQQLERI